MVLGIEKYSALAAPLVIRIDITLPNVQRVMITQAVLDE